MKQADDTQKVSAYAQAGVDIDSKMSGIEVIKTMVRTTATKGVVGGIGGFGGLFQSPGKENLLVASTDGVGTKLKVAVIAKKQIQSVKTSSTIASTISSSRGCRCFSRLHQGFALDPVVFKMWSPGCTKPVRRMVATTGRRDRRDARAHPQNEYDLVGTIVGTVPRKRLITGKKIKPGDVIMASLRRPRRTALAVAAR